MGKQGAAQDRPTPNPSRKREGRSWAPAGNPSASISRYARRMTPLEQLFEPANIILILSVTNFAAFAAFGIDKSLAEQQQRRISEARLLQLAFLGGIAGAYAGRALFRHKTRKQPFSDHLHAIAAIQLCAGAFLIVFFW